MIKRLISLSILILILASQVEAGFEVLGKGARPAAMGEAFTALADDPNAIWYNPAGLSLIKESQALGMYARLFPGLDTDKLHSGLVAYVQPLVRGLGSVGFGWTWLKADVYSENVLSLCYAFTLKERLSLGAGVKFLRWSADPYPGEPQDLSKSGLSLDIGVMVNIGKIFNYGALRAGGTIQNLNQPNLSKAGLDEGKLPSTLRVGLLFDTKDYSVEADVVRYRGQVKFLVGMEYKLTTPVDLRLRAGAIQAGGDFESGEYDAGFGITVKGVIIDYSYLHPIQIKQVGGSHRFSIGYKF